MSKWEKIRIALSKCRAELVQIMLGREPDSVKLAQALDDLQAIRKAL